MPYRLPLRRALRRVFLIGAMLLVVTARAGAAEAPPRFSFVALGCMPYGKHHYTAYERLLAEINRVAPAFVVHCGDTKAGSEPPSEAFLAQVKTWFDSVDSAVIYTPGDNEWTDVRRESNGSNDPLVWLEKIRRLYFAEERSLGRQPIPLVTQRRDSGFEKFVENARWTRDGVVFATVHVVGSNNNRNPAVASALAEFEERDRANAEWVRATFAAARSDQARGVALFFQAEPFGAMERTDRVSGFVRFLETIEEEARAFAKPVLLVHADAHRYRLQHGMRFRRGGQPVPNVTRLETFGADNIHAVLVVVDPAAPEVFLAGPLIVPSNPLPVLPRKK